MSADRPIDLKQDRRQWLKTSATILGSSLLPIPAVVAGVAQAKAEEAPKEKPAETKSPGRFFTPAQYVLVEELSETIIPQDSHSGGAKAAQVVVYIEQILSTTLDENRQANWQEGLHLIDLMSQHYSGKSFVDSSAEQRIALLTIIANHDFATELPEVRLFLDLRDLTIRGYYTSKIGIHDELDYQGNRMLAEFVGCGDPTPPMT